ncbi:hypothetical protein NPIL_87051 [Nephila pilipes]|uniref:Uncharacterized protein n=1 Tax=Nephila pilipes TaxID=299642 RepID=A0A8X6N7L8_NEPPI|nr:hypothetical protein NPIL_87051 [Nephila pilipes]
MEREKRKWTLDEDVERLLCYWSLNGRREFSYWRLQLEAIELGGDNPTLAADVSNNEMKSGIENSCAKERKFLIQMRVFLDFKEI